MEEDLVLNVQALAQRAINELDELASSHQRELKKLSQELLQTEELTSQDEERADHLLIELTRLETCRDHLMLEVDALRCKNDELLASINSHQKELSTLKKSIEYKKQTLKPLVNEVIEMEHDKENRIEKLKRDFKNVRKLNKIYRTYLDLNVEFERPDLFKIRFSSKKDARVSLTLRSLDLEDWEIVDASGDYEEEINYLQATQDITGVLFRVRRKCLKV